MFPHGGKNLLIGLGGHQEWDLNTPIQDRINTINEELYRIDPTAKIDFLDGVPSDAAEAETAAALGMPFRSMLDLFVIGGSDSWPDALESMQRCVEIARMSGTIQKIDMQIDGNSVNPSVAQVVDFLIRARALAEPYGIEICAETHIDRVTYDPRHLFRINDALLAATNGEYSLNVSADFSHYVHQIGNTHGILWDDIRNGHLNLNPEDPENFITSTLIPSGMIRMGHLRMAVPNNLDRTQGSIQYPLADPVSDPQNPKEYAGLRHYGVFNPDLHAPWQRWYEQLFRHILTSADPGPFTFNTEFIRYDGDYAQDAYRNRYQNLCMIAWAQNLKRRILAEEND